MRMNLFDAPPSFELMDSDDTESITRLRVFYQSVARKRDAYIGELEGKGSRAHSVAVIASPGRRRPKRMHHFFVFVLCCNRQLLLLNDDFPAQNLDRLLLHGDLCVPSTRIFYCNNERMFILANVRMQI